MHNNGSAYTNDLVVEFMDARDDMYEDSPSTESLAARVRGPKSPRTSPLLETDNNYNPKPNYGSEVDDLEPERKYHEDDERGYGNGFLPSPIPPRIPSGGIPQAFDVNVYQQKKTLAQGMMDLALISANANQARYVLSARGHPFFFASLLMISMSLILQVAVGIGLIWNSRYDVKEDADVPQANRANNWTVIGIFLVTILNVFISSFGVIDGDPDVVTIPFGLRSNVTDEIGSLEMLQRFEIGNFTDNSTLNDY